MKLNTLVLTTFIIAAGFSGLGAQSPRAMSLNGSTGLFAIPSGRIGWEQNSNLGLDLGYHTVISDGVATHIPKVNLSLFQWVELSAAFDIQPEGYMSPSNGTDFIGGLKFRLPLPTSAIALGGNFQALNFSNSDGYNYTAGQIYLAITYPGSLFNMPAETTVVLGKTFRQEYSDSNIDFGMGFDLMLLPNIFGGFIRWVTDFANFSYSAEPYSVNAWHRGVLNTGIRVDFSAIPVLNRYKFMIDLIMTDAFDDSRAFSVGAMFGIPLR